MGAINGHAADIDVSSEPSLERLLDAQNNQSGEAGGPEVVPAAANDQNEERQKADAAADNPTQTSPHRPSALALPRRSVVVLLGRAFLYFHSDSRNTVLT